MIINQLNWINLYNMNKKTFKEHVTTLVNLKKETGKIEGVIRESKINDSFSGGIIGLGWYEDLIVNVLQDAVNDENDNLGYWLYDLEMGKKWKKGTITDGDGKDIKLKTINDLIKLIYGK